MTLKPAQIEQISCNFDLFRIVSLSFFLSTIRIMCNAIEMTDPQKLI